MNIPTRPRPPESVLELTGFPAFMPAPDLADWIREVILLEDGVIHNPDLAHLEQAHLGILWTSADNSRKGRQVIGTAEIPTFRCGAWQKARQELQIRQWFGDMPDFLITLDAYFCDTASDVEFLALVEHELYHCAQQRDEFGMPKFNKISGEPSWEIRGHDVEEFVGVVRRYGVIDEQVGELVEAAQQAPEVARVNIARACGNCLLRSA